MFERGFAFSRTGSPTSWRQVSERKTLVNKILWSLALTLVASCAQVAAQTPSRSAPLPRRETSPATDAPRVASDVAKGRFAITLPPPTLFTHASLSPPTATDAAATKGGALFVLEDESLAPDDAGLFKARFDEDEATRAAPPDLNGKPRGGGFRWRPALQQSLLFLAVQHGYAMTQPKTRRDLKGKFFQDYIDSVKSLRGWADGGKFFTNYIAHPMQGSFVGFIQIQNDPKGMKQRFGASGDYWRSRMKALAWSAAWSTQFEIGPVSQAAIGNVGLHGKQTYVDLVVTPTVGIGMLVAEDALDRYLIERIERGTGNLYVTIGSRMFLNPTRTIANLFRFKKPWFRDRPRAR